MRSLAGKFITVEGIEGAGKSTALKFIKKLLTDNKIEHSITREPGGTEISEKIREILLDKTNNKMHSDTELLLMFAARAQHVNELVLPALKAGKFIISDRFVDSSLAYQGGGRGIDLKRIQKLADWTLGNLKPDITLLLDLEPEIGLKRINKRGASDRFELEKLNFFKNIREVFLWLARQEPERFFVVDSSKNIENTEAQVKMALMNII